MVELQLPLILVRTRKGLAILDRLGRWRGNKILGWILLFIMPISATIGLYIVLNSVSITISNALARSFIRSFSPLANILIPGLNPYLPIFYGWIALIIGLVVHEGAHGILARSAKLTVKSTGLLLFLGIPIGAFAEIDDKELSRAPARDSGRILAAGPGGNVLIGLVALAGLLLTVSTMTPITNGVGVFSVAQDYPVYQSGITPGDIITGVNGKAATLEDITEVISSLKPGDAIQFSVLRIKGHEVHSNLDFTVTLAVNPANRSLPYAGFTLVDPGRILDNYRSVGLDSPLVYLLWPTISAGQSAVPYSDMMGSFYTSSIGPIFQPLSNLFFWVWFVNFNIAIFNALPLYPLDGGQAFKIMIRGFAGGRISDRSISRITYVVTLVILSLVLSMIFLPYLLY
jgi:membrane-associated protease RseP (regulator of RpoE activity)